MIGLAIRLALGGKALIGGALSWATANATRMLAIGLALALAWGAIERHGKHKAQKVLASTVIAWKAAEREATAAQLAANAAQQARWTQQAKETDDGYQKARIDADSRAERFIAANRVRNACPRSTGGSDPLPGTASAPGIDGPGGITVVDAVTVPADDVRICTRNTGRLDAARDWALGL